MKIIVGILIVALAQGTVAQLAFFSNASSIFSNVFSNLKSFDFSAIFGGWLLKIS